jgi:hypothetical protein
MLLTRPFAHRRATLVAVAGALVLATFLALPQGQAFAASLLQFFRGQTLKPVATDMAHIQNAYQTIENLENIGTLQGTVPRGLDPMGSVAQAASVSGLTLAQPNSLPAGINTTPRAQAVAPQRVILTLNKAKADAYFQSQGSSLRMQTKFNGAQIIVDFPGVALLEYGGTNGSGKVFLGQAGQMNVQLSVTNITVDEMKAFLLSMPGLSPDNVAALNNITNWQTSIPLAIPTDRAGWQTTSVGGSFAGSGVILNDNTGIGSALLWQTNAGTRSLGLAGYGLKAADLQNIAGSLR